MPSLLRTCLLLLALASVAGCGNSCSLSGSVTFNNEPVNDGWIHLTPANGLGQPASAPIKNGRYTIHALQPAPHVVLIESIPEIAHAKTTAEMEEQARKGNLPSSNLENLIPPDAEGNNVTIELTSGRQARNFSLNKKAS